MVFNFNFKNIIPVVCVCRFFAEVLEVGRTNQNSCYITRIHLIRLVNSCFQDYLGIVVGRRPPRSVGGNTTTIQEYCVIDHRVEPFIVAIWGNNFTDTTFSTLNALEQRSLVAFLSFTSTYRHGISLMSTRDSIILFYTNFETFTSLEDRYIQQTPHYAKKTLIIKEAG